MYAACVGNARARAGRGKGLPPSLSPFPRAISALHVIVVRLRREKDVGSKNQRVGQWNHSTCGDSVIISRGHH